MRDDVNGVHPDLEEYFDRLEEELPHDVRLHLQSCGRCAGELEALIELRERARSLPREIAPSIDLWPGIASRIERTPARVARPRLHHRGGERRHQSRGWWGSLAAAAVALLVIGAGTFYLSLTHLEGDSPTIAEAPDETSGGLPRAPGLAAFASAEPEYRSTVELLEAELAARRDQLDPATVAVVERNLAIIDSAIVEARRALAADPSSVDLPLLLAGIYRQKLGLLQQAVLISARI